MGEKWQERSQSANADQAFVYLSESGINLGKLDAGLDSLDQDHMGDIIGLPKQIQLKSVCRSGGLTNSQFRESETAS